MFDRIKQWRTTTTGMALSGLVYGLLESMGCKVPSDPTLLLITLIPLIQGALSSDKKKE